MTGYSIMGLVDPPGRIVEGEIRLNGRDLRALSPAEWQAVRGNRIAMIFQDPMMTLNPVLRIDTQMIEAVRAHAAVSAEAARERAREALVRVGIPSPDERLRRVSAPVLRRHAPARRDRDRALNKPDLIIADEPTTALDVTIQGQILAEMQKLCRESGTALIWITHDLSVVAGLADEVCVMYAGKIVEHGTVDEVLDAPLHPYTRGLLDSVPSRNRPRRAAAADPGHDAVAPRGCRRAARSASAARARPRPACSEPPLYPLGDRQVRCFHPIHVEDEEAVT